MNKQVNLLEALDIVARHLNSSKVDWLLGGSASLMVHGVDIFPNDLDILVNPADFEFVTKSFNEIATSFSNNPRKFTVNGVLVEILKLRKRGKEEKVMFDGNKIPVNILSEELSYYESREGKETIVEMILEKLQA